MLLNCIRNLQTILLNDVPWTKENIFSMDKKKEMTVTIFFFGRVLSMISLVLRRNI